MDSGTTGAALADRDPVTAGLCRMIDDGAVSLLSFDVFDTLLWRRVPRPIDLFGLLGQRLRAEGLAVAWLTPHAFVRLRQDAEARARWRRGDLGPEVSLHEIWAEMPPELFPDGGVERLAAREVDLEREYTVVDVATAALVAAARRHDVPIVLVSDTYFTAEQLHRLLDRPELDLPPDVRIFRSHGHGTDKGSQLWPVVLAATGVEPVEIVHVGDNPIADVEVPAERGIRCVHYERVDDAFAAVLDRETPPDDAYSDLGLTTLRARTVGAAGPGTSRREVARRWGAGILGPVLTGFAEFVARSAHERGIPVVWCPMREGELLSALVNAAARARGWDVEARPLWLSRHVAWLATLDAVDEGSIKDVMYRTFRATVRGVLESLGLRPGEVPDLATHLDAVVDDEELIERVAEAVTETPYLRHRLAVTAVARRRRLVTALRATGALDAPELVLVDLGWGGTIQLQLARALRLAGVGVEPSGLYLATDQRSVRLFEAGLRAEGFLGTAGRPEGVAGALARSPEAVELAVNATCGSLVDFDEVGGPILGPTADVDDQALERRAVQQGVHDFQDRWNAYVDRDPTAWPELAGALGRAWLGEIVRAALDAPTPDEAGLFASWSHEDNLGSDRSTLLLPAELLPAVEYMSPSDVLDLRQRDAFWPQLLAASDPRLGALLAAVRDGAVSLDAVDGRVDGLSRARLMVRTADGHWWPGADAPARINHHGLSYVRLSAHSTEIDELARQERDDAEDEDGDGVGRIVEVSVAPAGRPALVRIDWIAARIVRVGGEVVTARWESAAELAGLHLDAAAWLGGNLFELRNERAALVLPVGVRAGGPIDGVEVSVGLGVLPRSVCALAPPAPPAGTRARMAARLREEYHSAGAVGVLSGAARLARRQVGGR